MKNYKSNMFMFLFVVLAAGMLSSPASSQEGVDETVEIISGEISIPNEQELSDVDAVSVEDDMSAVTDDFVSEESEDLSEVVSEESVEQAPDASSEASEMLETSNQAEPADAVKQKVKKGKDILKGKAAQIPVPVDSMPSLFFTHYQYQAIMSSKNKRGVVRPPTEAELAALDNGESLELDPERRYITLGGIVYRDKDDWTIWLNGKRVTPTAVPREVLDLVVYKDYIEVKWIDETTNQIFPLRMKSHQRFNMDMRIFLPG